MIPRSPIAPSIRSTLHKSLQWVRTHLWAIIPVSIFLTGFATYALLYIPVKHVVVDFTTPQICQSAITLFPNQHSQSNSESIEIKHQDFTTLGRLTLWSSQSCVEFQGPPTPGQHTVRVSLGGNSLISQTYRLTISDLPTVTVPENRQPLSVTKPLLLSMSQPDLIHQYSLGIESDQVPCQVNTDILSCPINQMDLRQGQSYQLAINRQFLQSQPDTIAQAKIETLTATTITEASIDDGQTIYSRLRSLEVKTDKPIATAQAKLTKINKKSKDNQKTEDPPADNPQPKPAADTIEVQVDIKDQTIKVRWSEHLSRQETYRLTIYDLLAQDDSTLEDDYQLTFITSGGPKLQKISIPRAGVKFGTPITVTFDQDLDSQQDLRQIVSLNGNQVTATVQGPNLSFTLPNLPPCREFTIAITGTIVSRHGVDRKTDWTYNSRTICHTTEVIGHSVQGRPIIAYKFGSGSTAILYTGAIHGNEVGTKHLMDAWINDLELKAHQIPAGRTIVVVPLINPDGFAAGRRNNANNVDLNRNFAVSDWQSDITDPYNNPLPGGGGKKPMSEPEAQALANLTSRLKPRTTMSFHNIGGYVIGNQASHSRALAQLYAQLSGYRDGTGQSSQIFSYPITGTYDDWVAEKLGLASILVEMHTRSDPELSRNLNALWRVASY